MLTMNSLGEVCFSFKGEFLD